MNPQLAGKKVLILFASGFEEKEFTETQRAFLKAGIKMTTASVDTGLANAWNGTGWGLYFMVDSPIGAVLASDFDGLVIPGGDGSVLKLSKSAHTRRIINNFLDGDKPLGVIGQGLSLLAMAGEKLKDRTLTSPPSAKDALEACGAVWQDQPVHVDRNLITARDLPAMSSFIDQFLQALALQGAVPQAA